jgi:hypothetical protein
MEDNQSLMIEIVEAVDAWAQNLEALKALPFGPARVPLWRDTMCPLLLTLLKKIFLLRNGNLSAAERRFVIVSRNKVIELMDESLVQVDPIAMNGCKEVESVCNGLLNQQS